MEKNNENSEVIKEVSDKNSKKKKTIMIILGVICLSILVYYLIVMLGFRIIYNIVTNVPENFG